MILTLNVDGGARGNPGPAAAGVVLREDDGHSLLEAGYLLGKMTNNQAEYCALLLGLRAASGLGARELKVFSDSELMVRQITGQYRVKSRDLRSFFNDVMRELNKFDSWSIEHVRRENNSHADELLNRALDQDEDVIDVQKVEAAPSLTPNPKASNKQGAADSARPVRVEIAAGTAKKPCCEPERRFVIRDQLPPGLNLKVAAKIIQAVGEIRQDRARTRIVVTCDRCGAHYELSAESDDKTDAV